MGSQSEDIGRERIAVFYWYLAPMKIDSEMAIVFMLIDINNAFYTCAVEG